MTREIRQNRPGWRKVRGIGKKMRKKDRMPVKDMYGNIRFDKIKVKTKKWERVK